MSELIQWRTDWQEALNEAKKANRSLALEFFMDGWPHCGRLVRETHQDPAVVQALNERFIPVRLEGRNHMDLVQQFQVTGAPTTILFSPEGQEKHRFPGFYPAEEYLKELVKGNWWSNFEKNLSPKRSWSMKKYICQVCGYVYDPEAGDPDNVVPPGTPFEQLPDSWVCPVCGASKDSFESE